MADFLCIIDYGGNSQERVRVIADSATDAAEKSAGLACTTMEEFRVVVQLVGPKEFYKVTRELKASPERNDP